MRKILIVVFVFAVACISCKKNSLISTPLVPNVQATDYNAIAVGDKWVYELTDSSYGFIGQNPVVVSTMQVQVTGTKQMSDGKDAYIFEIQKNGKAFDTLYKRVENGKIIIISNKETANQIVDVLNVPFTNGQSWDAVPLLYHGNKYFVGTSSNYNALLPFGDVFVIDRKSSPEDLGLIYEHFAFKPFVGFVEITNYFMAVDMSYTSKWRLQHYELK